MGAPVAWVHHPTNIAVCLVVALLAWSTPLAWWPNRAIDWFDAVGIATYAQIKQARGIAEVVCVQNPYNLAHRDDDALIDELAGSGVAYVPLVPFGGFAPLQSSTLSQVATKIGATAMQTALAWLLHRAPNILLIPGTWSLGHLRENLAAVEFRLPEDVRARLDAIGNSEHQ
jgi:pyridoxine 4-dehydrogenase